jgi:hypothetical protein
VSERLAHKSSVAAKSYMANTASISKIGSSLVAQLQSQSVSIVHKSSVVAKSGIASTESEIASSLVAQLQSQSVNIAYQTSVAAKSVIANTDSKIASSLVVKIKNKKRSQTKTIAHDVHDDVAHQKTSGFGRNIKPVQKFL